jgi:hypothetical protein
MPDKPLIFRDGMVLLSDQTVSPLDMLREVNPDAVPDPQPPAAANYRVADLQAVSCAGCAKFVFTGSFDGDVPQGYCSQWEALVQGDHVSDAFADSGPPLDDDGNEVWDFADDQKIFNEIHLAGTEQREEEGFVIKEILRTGEWPVIPTKSGLVKKPLRVVRDGKSNSAEGTIALAELVENFKANVIGNVQIPLSDDKDDHKNITKVNTGYVRDLWIADDGDGSKLVAKMEFTEPEVKEKVLRGTYADVSCGIPWKIVSRGQQHGATLEHVAITNRPFIDGLGPFLAASDDNKAEGAEFAHFGDFTDTEIDIAKGELQIASFVKTIDDINTALVGQLGLSQDYEAIDITREGALIRNKIADTTWTVPFKIEDEKVSLSSVGNWTVKDEGTDDAPAPNSAAPRSASDEDDLEVARRLREIRLSQPNSTSERSEHMPRLTREELERLDLTDEQRAAFQAVLDENVELSAKTKESEADRRVDELKDLGLEERPGFLKFYRQVHLSDDGGPAAVLLSDNGQEKERLTSLQILDRAIEALKGSDGKVVLSDQALASGNDNAPPNTAVGEQKPLAERVAEAKAAIGQK